jgi:leucyl-tRNA synthetase
MIIRDGAKMSKSKGNVVNPDAYIEEWGADAFRMYLMFLGPFEEGGDFRDAGIIGVKRFLDRVWMSVHAARSDGAPDSAVMRRLHRAIRKVGEDIPKLSYNTAVAEMMEYLNVLRYAERTPHRAEVEPLVQLVSPFAPHVAEELWEQLGHATSVFDSRWPVFDAALATEETVAIVVQVDGKVRGTVQAPRGTAAAAADALARKDASLAKYLAAGVAMRKHVPDRMLSYVTKAS